MTYSSTGLIQAADYNTLVWGSSNGTPSVSSNNLYLLWGTGYGSRGMGQAMDLVPLAMDTNQTLSGAQSTGELYSVTGGSTQTVSAVQWSGLVGTINRMLYHQNSVTSNIAITYAPGVNSAGTFPGVRVGDTIAVVSGLTSALTSINTQMLSSTGRVASLTTTSTAGYLWNFASTATFQTVSPIERQIAFASGDQARYFFNSGGYIRVRISAQDNTGGGTARSASMAACINRVGSINITGSTNGGVATNNLPDTITGSGKGYWALPIISGVGDYSTGLLGGFVGDPSVGVYTDDKIKVFAGVSGDVGTNGSRGSVLRVAVSLDSGFAATGAAGLVPSWQTDSMNVTVNVNIDYVQPLTTSGGGMLINTWGTPTVGLGPLSV